MTVLLSIAVWIVTPALLPYVANQELPFQQMDFCIAAAPAVQTPDG